MREVLAVAWPLMASMLGHTAIGLVDALMVSPLGEDAVGAVGLAHTVTLVPFCAGFGLLNGARVAVAQATGAGDRAAANEAVRQGVVVALVLGAVTLCLAPFAEFWAHIAGAEGELHANASAWMRVRLLGLPLQFVALALGAGFDGRGETRVTMRLNLVANAVNVALCLLWVPGRGPFPALGVVGSAWATFVANLVQLGLIAWASRGLIQRVATPRADRRAMLRRILFLGGPTGVQWALEVLSWSLLSGLLAGFPPAHLAAHTVVSRVVGVSFLPGHALGEAAGILVGQAVGARDAAAARRVVRSALLSVVLLMGTMGTFFGFLPGLLLGPFALGAAASPLAFDLLLAAAVFQVFDGIALVSQSALNGAGDSRFTMASGLLLTWLFWVPLAAWYAARLGYGAPGGWAALTAHVLAMATVWSTRWRSGRPLDRALTRSA